MMGVKVYDSVVTGDSPMKTKIENKDWIFVDIQGYKVNRNRFMCKEICLIDGIGTFYSIIKSWYPFKKLLFWYKRQIEWITKHFHGLIYECGSLRINEMRKIVYSRLLDKIVIVKGAEKVEWMKYLFRNYGEIDCRNIKYFDYAMSGFRNTTYDLCGVMYDWSKCHCSLSNAKKLQEIAKF